MHSVCWCSLQAGEVVFLRRVPSWHIFTPPWIRLGRIWLKNNNTCNGSWVLHAYQVSSKSNKRLWWRSRKCKLSNGRRTNGQRTTLNHNRSLDPRLVCPKKYLSLFASFTLGFFEGGIDILVCLQPDLNHQHFSSSKC